MAKPITWHIIRTTDKQNITIFTHCTQFLYPFLLNSPLYFCLNSANFICQLSAIQVSKPTDFFSYLCFMIRNGSNKNKRKTIYLTSLYSLVQIKTKEKQYIWHPYTPNSALPLLTFATIISVRKKNPKPKLS